jgi:hypothetical protein
MLHVFSPKFPKPASLLPYSFATHYEIPEAGFKARGAGIHRFVANVAA